MFAKTMLLTEIFVKIQICVLMHKTMLKVVFLKESNSEKYVDV